MTLAGVLGLDCFEEPFGAVRGEGAMSPVPDEQHVVPGEPDLAGESWGSGWSEARHRAAVIVRGTIAVPVWSMNHCCVAGSIRDQSDLRSTPEPGLPPVSG